jgi:hypothetical protein
MSCALIGTYSYVSKKTLVGFVYNTRSRGGVVVPAHISTMLSGLVKMSSRVGVSVFKFVHCSEVSCCIGTGLLLVFSVISHVRAYRNVSILNRCLRIWPVWGCKMVLFEDFTIARWFLLFSCDLSRIGVLYQLRYQC